MPSPGPGPRRRVAATGSAVVRTKRSEGKGAHTTWLSSGERFTSRRLCGRMRGCSLSPQGYHCHPTPPPLSGAPRAGNTPSVLWGATPREHPTAILLRLRRRPLDLHELVERKVVGRDAGVVNLLEAHDDRVAITGFRNRRHRPTAIRHEFTCTASEKLSGNARRACQSTSAGFKCGRSRLLVPV